jgi:PAS domain S-box-containing protein
LLAALIGSILSHTVSRQLRRLNQGVRSVGEGDLSCTVDTGTRDEIGDLSRSFDSMTQKLALREQDLKEQEQRFRRLFENSNDGIIIHTLEQTILDVNRRMLELTGLSRETLLSRSMTELIHQPSEDGCTEALVSGLHQHGGQLEVRMLQADGGTIEVDIRTTLIDPDEGIIQSVVRDITERKQAEQQLKHQMLEISQANYRLEVLVSNTAERERRMVQLKQEVNELLRSKGLPKKYQAPDEVERQLGTGLTQPPPGEGPASGNDRSGCASSMES